jgi:hypothetical protein
MKIAWIRNNNNLPLNEYLRKPEAKRAKNMGDKRIRPSCFFSENIAAHPIRKTIAAIAVRPRSTGSSKR